jgi:hypothetical protein
MQPSDLVIGRKHTFARLTSQIKDDAEHSSSSYGAYHLLVSFGWPSMVVLIRTEWYNKVHDVNIKRLTCGILSTHWDVDI